MIDQPVQQPQGERVLDNDTVLKLILDGQNAIAGKLNSVEERLITRLDNHTSDDTGQFRAIREEIGTGFGGLRDRLTRVEMISDTVDSLADTASDHEQRIVLFEGDKQASTAIKGWVQWLVMALIGMLSALAAWIVKR